jgi:hypothetical protein
MTQQEIQERNKQIALMLGYKTTWLDKLFYTWKCRFLYDWNLLMEAVEFIEKLNKTDKEIVWTKAATKKEAVFIAVSDFAKLYNNKEL